MANLRAGMVGIGSMGKNHVRNLRAIDGVDLVAIAPASCSSARWWSNASRF